MLIIISRVTTKKNNLGNTQWNNKEIKISYIRKDLFNAKENSNRTENQKNSPYSKAKKHKTIRYIGDK